MIRFWTKSTAIVLALVFGPSLMFARSAGAQDPKTESPRITATEPAALVSGKKETFKLRGFQLKGATLLQFPDVPEITAEIKESGDAGQAKGLENKLAGDTQLVAEVDIPAELQSKWLDYVVETPMGPAKGKINLLSGGGVIDEREPNDGFREAQELQFGQAVRGSIQSDRDVDVFALSARAGQRLKIAVASGGPLLMDAALHCYDHRGQFLAAADDQETRDPALTLDVKFDGTVFLCVTSSHDIGGPWHSYLLTVEESQ